MSYHLICALEYIVRTPVPVQYLLIPSHPVTVNVTLTTNTKARIAAETNHPLLMSVSPCPEQRAFPKLPDLETEPRLRNKDRNFDKSCWLPGSSRLSKNNNNMAIAIPLPKPRLLQLPWIGDLVFTSLGFPKNERNSVLSQTSPQKVLFEEGANRSSAGVPTPRQEMVTCDEGINASSTSVPANFQAPRQEMDTGEERSDVKFQRVICHKALSTIWLLILLFVIHIVPAPVAAQITTTEYVTFVAGSDTSWGPLSNTPPNVYPGGRAYHAGFYDRTQKCFYTFGGVGGAGNSRHTGTIVSSNFIAALARCARTNFSNLW